MKIGINLLGLFPGKMGGMENYCRELIDGFIKNDGGNNEYYLILNNFGYGIFEDKKRIYKIKIEDAGDPLILAKTLSQIIEENKIDFWFCPLLDLFPRCLKIPSAVTIPDMQHEHYSEFFKKEVLLWRKNNLKPSCDIADIVFTLSEFSAKDISEKLGIEKDKIVPAYIGCSDIFKNQKIKGNVFFKAKYDLPDKYIFYPANFWPHKNHENLFRAVKQYKKIFKKDINLVLTGYDENNLPVIEKNIESLGLKNNVRILGYLDAGDMPFVYANAQALVFPSLFEGFGMPIIEAMWQDCPVLCSKNTSLPEIGKDAVLYIDPENPKDIALKINEIIENKKLRNALIEKGRVVRELFSYEKCAKQTLKTIEKAVENWNKNTKKDIKISIVTPSYNQARFIRETIESVVSQDYPNIEYFIIDGGSTDGSVDIIREYAEKYKFIKWVSKKDSGPVEAINKGLKMASGDIVAYINSDDTYFPGAIKEIVEYFYKNKNLKIIYGEGMHIDENGKKIVDYSTRIFDENLLKEWCFICQPSLFMRREVLEKVGPFDERRKTCWDYEYWIRAYKHYYLGYIPVMIATSRLYPECITVNLRQRAIIDSMQIVKKYYGYVPLSWFYTYAGYKISKVDQIIVKKEVNEFHRQILAAIYEIKYNYKYPVRLSKDLIIILKRIYSDKLYMLSPEKLVKSTMGILLFASLIISLLLIVFSSSSYILLVAPFFIMVLLAIVEIYLRIQHNIDRTVEKIEKLLK